MEIRRYVLVDRENNEDDSNYESYPEAESEARKRGCAVIARVFEYTDSELIWTPNGASVWPPRDAGNQDCAVFPHWWANTK